MHGIIFKELKDYVEKNVGGGAWEKLMVEAGLGRKIFLPTQAYADEDIVKLVTAASKATGSPAGDILHSFGEYITPQLIKLFGALIKPDWKTLDLLEHTENTIHRVVRLQTPGAAPPKLVAERVSDDEVVIRYTSERRMCSLAKGIISGVANHYGDDITVEEPSCMLQGASECRISVRRSA